MATEFSDRDGGLGGLGIDKHGHDSLGPMDPHLLAHPGGHLGYSASDAMFLDEGYIEVPAHTFVNDTPQPERSNDVAPTVPVPLQSNGPEELLKLKVGLYHKTRGGRNTFGAISEDAMVRVTKGVGKRLQLRVDCDSAQLELLRTSQMLPAGKIPFRWPNFSVTLEELSIASGTVISEKACDLDMMEVLMPIKPEDGTVEPTAYTADGTGLILAHEPVPLDTPLLVAQCELKLFHLSKTLRFRVEYATPTHHFLGYSLMFYTHDSGKSKKVAFGNPATDLAAPAPAPAKPSPTATINSSAIHTGSSVAPSSNGLQVPAVVVHSGMPLAHSDPHAQAHHLPHQQHIDHQQQHPQHNHFSHHQNPWGTQEAEQESQGFSTPSATFSPYSGDEEPSGSSTHSISAQHPYSSAYGLSSSPSESEEYNYALNHPTFERQPAQHQAFQPVHALHASQHVVAQQNPQNNVAPQWSAPAGKSSKSHRSGKRSPSHASYQQSSPHPKFEYSEENGTLEASSSSSCSSGSGLLTPSDSSTLMDTDTYSRGEFSSDHESTARTTGESVPEGYSFSGSNPSSLTSSARPFSSAGGSASSSLSSEDGNSHMASGARRAAKSRTKRSPNSSTKPSPRPHKTSSTATIGFDSVDEQIDRQLSQRTSSKKRKPDEMTSIPVQPEFPFVVDGSLDVKGVVRAQAFAQFSDIRFKTNVEDLTDALNIVTQLRGKKYEWKDNINGATTAQNLSGGRKVIGLIAQEVKRVLPEVVVTDKNGFLSLNYTDMVPLLIEALKQHVETSKQEKSEIKESISELRAKVDELSSSLTDSASYLDYSDDDLAGSFQDEDWDLSDSFPRSASHPFRRRGSRASSVSSTSSVGGGNDGDLTASSASLPDDIPLPLQSAANVSLLSSMSGEGHGSAPGTPSRSPSGGVSSLPNVNAPKSTTSSQATTAPRPTGEKARKTSRQNSLSTISVPGVTLIACMTHKRINSGGSSTATSSSPSSPSSMAAAAPLSTSPTSSSFTGLGGGGWGPAGSTNFASEKPAAFSVVSSSPAPKKTDSGVKASKSTGNIPSSNVASTTSSSPSTPPSLDKGGLSSSGSRDRDFKDKEKSDSKEKIDPATGLPMDRSKRTATQRISRSFTSFLHHIQASTSNIMSSAANFTKSSSSSSSSNPALSASPPADESPLSDGEGSNLSSSSSSVSSSGSSSSPSMAGHYSGSSAGVAALGSQLTALSLASSTSEVKAQVLVPGFTRLTPATIAPLKNQRAVHRAVVLSVSAWHLWSNSDEEKLFLDDADARHSLIMTGKAVSQIETTFPECTVIHTVSIDMRGTVQSTVEDIISDLQKRQVPADVNSSGTHTSTTSVQSQLEQADLVWLIGHSQGIQVAVHVCERLLRNGVLSSGEQLISVLSLGGLHNNCAYSLMSLHGNPTIYAALHNFGNSRRNFREYKQALAKLLENGVPITTVGAYQDTLINVTSSSLEYVKHPNILRALLVHHEFKDKFDPRHAFKKASNFNQEMVRFALEMRNKNRIVDMLPFVNSNDTTADVQETTSWIAHAKTFPRDKLHQLLFSPHIEFPATVPGFYYALGATMSMFNTRAFRFHKSTRQLREGIQRHREIPFAQDCYRVSLEWLLTRVSQGSPLPASASIPTSKALSSSSVPMLLRPSSSTSSNSASSNPSSTSASSTGNGTTFTANTGSTTKKRSKREAAKVTPVAPPAPSFPPLLGVEPIFKEGSNGFSYDFAEQVQTMATSCSKAETARLQSAFRYWRPEGPKELLVQKLVMRSLGWSVSESPALAQYMDGLSEIVGAEKDRTDSASSSSSASSPSSSSPLYASSPGHASPRGSRKDANDSDN